MYQQDLGLNLCKRRTRKAVFLDEMILGVSWTELLPLISPDAPCANTGRPSFALKAMLRIHFVQHWCHLSDMAMEEVQFETELYWEFVGPTSGERIPDRVSILCLRNLPLKHKENFRLSDLSRSSMDQQAAHSVRSTFRLACCVSGM